MKLPLRYTAPTIRDAEDHAICDMVYGSDEERETNAMQIIEAANRTAKAYRRENLAIRRNTAIGDVELYQRDSGSTIEAFPDYEEAVEYLEAIAV